MTKGIKRRLNRILDAVTSNIERNTNKESLFSRGLAWEGYDGGYAQAIQDVMLALNGVEPSTSYWKDTRP